MASSVGYGIGRFIEDVGAMVASHGERTGAKDLSAFRGDPVGFIRTVLKFDSFAMQDEIAGAVRDHEMVAVRGCNGAGKDAIAAALALWWVYAVRGSVLITGPTERQVRNVVMGEVSRMFHRARNLPGQLFEMALRVPGDEAQGILAFTTNDASKLTGFHAPRLLVILTEAQGVEGLVWEGIHANVTGKTSRVLVVGNPLIDAGKFYEACNSPHWRSFKISALDHPNVTGERNIPGAVSRAFCDRMAQEYGVGSSVYRARVLSEFPDGGAEALVRRSWLEAAAVRWETRALEGGGPAMPWVAAVDPARYGVDHTALAIRQGPIVRHVLTWGQASTMETVERCERELLTLRIALRFRGRHDPMLPGGAVAVHGHCRPGVLLVDSIGVGAGVFDRFRELRCNVREFNAASAAPGAGRDRFANRRAYAYWGLRHLLEHDLIALPRDLLLWDELAAIHWSTNLSGRIQMEAKDDIRARLGRSTDRADAVSACVEGLYQPQGTAWKRGTFCFA